jgi:hypothetical protein
VCVASCGLLTPVLVSSMGPQEVEGRDLLAVLSDSGKLTFLGFSTTLHRFVVVSHVSIDGEGECSIPTSSIGVRHPSVYALRPSKDGHAM